MRSIIAFRVLASIAVLSACGDDASPSRDAATTDASDAATDSSEPSDSSPSDVGLPDVISGDVRVPTSGAEARCAELAAHCLCSEPMNADEGTFTTGHDFSDSDDSTECVGDRAGASVLGVGSDGAKMSVDVSSDASWGTVSWAVAHDGADFIWINPPTLTEGAPLAPSAAVRTLCMRYYKKVDDAYSPAGSSALGADGSCERVHGCSRDGDFFNCRNKLFQANFGGHLIQAEEQSNGDCPAEVDAFNPLDFYVSGSNLDERFAISPTVDWNDCDDAPCRLELCIDGNIAVGTQLQVRVRLTSLEPGGPEGTGMSSVFDATSGPTIADFWGADLFHSGPIGAEQISHFMVATWETDTDEWIGAAFEIE